MEPPMTQTMTHWNMPTVRSCDGRENRANMLTIQNRTASPIKHRTVMVLSLNFFLIITLVFLSK